MATSNENIKNSKSRYIRLSSEDKVSGTQGRFVIDLIAQGGIIDNVKGMIVHSIQCPNVFDNIPVYANSLQLIKTTGAVIYDIIIPNSYYYINDLITQLQTSINTAIGPDTVVVTSVGSNPVQKLNFVFTGDTYSFNFDNSTIAYRLGLTADIGPLANITLQSIPNLIGETELYVHSRTIAPNHLMEGTGSFSVLDKINLDQPYGAMCYTNFNNDTTHFVKYFPYESLKTLRTIKITLRNRIGEILVLPDNFDFTMMVTVFYK